MSCTEERANQIAELAGGRLDGAALEELLEHVEGCPACSAELDLAAELAAGAARPAPRAATERTGLNPASLAWPLAAAALALLVIGIRLLVGGDREERDPARLARLTPLPAQQETLRAPTEDDAAWRAAMEHYAAGTFGPAAEALAALEPTEAGRALRDLYLGLCRAQTEEYEAADTALASAAEHGTGLVRERARWMRAQVRLALGDGDGARRILRALLEGGGEYAPNAAAQLLELDGRFDGGTDGGE